MPVYVDDMRAKFGRLVMCHMIADTEEELLTMADRIGVQRRWIQYPGTYRVHFDIALNKRALAVAAGAKEITWRQAGMVQMRRRQEEVKGLERMPIADIVRTSLETVHAA